MQNGQQKFRVLIVEDFSALGNALRDVLRLEGFEVERVSNGKEALEHMEKGQIPDAVIVDYKMPVLGGAQLLQILKEDPKYGKVTRIATSAMTNEQFCKDAHYFIKKPLDTTALLKVLNEKRG